MEINNALQAANNAATAEKEKEKDKEKDKNKVNLGQNFANYNNE